MPRNRQGRATDRPGDAQDRAGPEASGARARGDAGRTTFSDWLAADGAPWRPFDERGVLVPARALPEGVRAARSELFDRERERQLFRHLKTTCVWRARDRDRTWRLGDYSWYSLEFTTQDFETVSLRFWSEPDERNGGGTVSFAIAASAWDAEAAGATCSRRVELLRDHGFETARRSRDPRQYRKQLVVADARGVRALAREAIAILCGVFGFDGAAPLDFHLHLGTRLSAGFTFDGICASDLLKLMQRWGFPATELEERAGGAPMIKSTVLDQPFLVAFVGERAGSAGEYGMIGLRTFLRFEEGVPEGLPNAINTSFATVKASVDEDGDLVVQTPIILHGGVTAVNLEMCFKVWRETLEEIAQGLE
jgi:hypothetical protein